MCPGRAGGTGFSLWSFVLANSKPHRLKPVLLGTELLPRARDHFVHFVHTSLQIFGLQIRSHITIRANQRQSRRQVLHGAREIADGIEYASDSLRRRNGIAGRADRDTLKFQRLPWIGGQFIKKM